MSGTRHTSGSDGTAPNGPLRSLTELGVRLAMTPLRPFGAISNAALDAGRGLGRRAVERGLDSPELEWVLTAAVDSERVEAAIRTALASDGIRQIVNELFDAGLFDLIIDRLLESPALWRLVDEVASSPAVTAAITQQGLGFADQVGDRVRTQSRSADDWLERAAARLARRRSGARP